MKLPLPWALAAAALVGVPSPSHACSCLLRYETCTSLRAAAAVFEATVDHVEATSAPSGAARSVDDRLERITFREVQPWRGAAATSLVTPADSSRCGYDFEVGERYLVVAHAEEGRGLTVSSCSLTRPVAEARGILDYLEHAGDDVRPLAVWGQVTRASRWADFQREYVPVTGALVTVQGPTRREAVADADGWYSVLDLLPGRYTVTARAPSSEPQLGAMEPVDVEVAGEPANTCAEVDFVAPIVSAISGVVIDERGNPVAGAFVELRLADQHDLSRGAAGLGFTTDATGRYRFQDLPPGRYEVGINLAGAAREGSASLYATSAAGARTLELALGGQLTLAPLRVRR
jgi:hypothetical protein